MMWYKKSSVRGLIGPVLLDLFVGTSNYLTYVNPKTNCDQNQKNEIRYNKIINGLKFISLYYFGTCIRDIFVSAPVT